MTDKKNALTFGKDYVRFLKNEGGGIPIVLLVVLFFDWIVSQLPHMYLPGPWLALAAVISVFLGSIMHVAKCRYLERKYTVDETAMKEYVDMQMEHAKKDDDKPAD